MTKGQYYKRTKKTKILKGAQISHETMGYWIMINYLIQIMYNCDWNLVQYLFKSTFYEILNALNDKKCAWLSCLRSWPPTTRFIDHTHTPANQCHRQVVEPKASTDNVAWRDVGLDLAHRDREGALPLLWQDGLWSLLLRCCQWLHFGQGE